MRPASLDEVPRRPVAKTAAVFLDRDGTIIEDRGDLRSPGDVSFCTGAIEALQALHEHFLLFIVTNQSGIAAGRLTEAEAIAVNDQLIERLRSHGVGIKEAYICPHSRADGCACIKPKTYFLELAARDYGIDLRRSYTVGDHPHDVELARHVGGTGIYVLSGHGSKHLKELGPGQLVVRGIREASDAILECTRREAVSEYGPVKETVRPTWSSNR